eukprot:CAMPEP_0201868770 /NCGR_PEP_ID=MMETSP0902-20130614/2523_1 /ASSEMBLY_ACC=CAM_ASM_000551 /TAXON_ID=420261 /ORGANISM="Thalassiosira antarctica, Strain CCMP982" /LENGTH=259 /DNA_ID=CAMNT_0048394149 /DNA_START=210 /DNA_END=989 /DNA_ORIENTATION=+
MITSPPKKQSILRRAAIMAFPNEEAVASDGRRDRSYSDAHALIYSKTNSSHNSSDINESNAPSNNKMTCTKKHHSHHQHHHHGSRPRSKSLDLHHHSTPVHKKKYPHQHKHIPRPLSHGGYHIDVGRVSPSSPKLKGKMWIRPAAMRGQIPFIPALTSAAPSPSSKEPQQVEDGGFTNLSPLVNSSPVRQVTNGSSSSPTSFDDEMMLYASPNSSFDSYQRQGHSPAKIIFGESGKPIKLKPRTLLGITLQPPLHHKPL